MEKREILKRKLDREVKSTSRLDCFAPTNLILLRPIKNFDWSFNRFNWAGRGNQKERNLDNISSLDMAFIRRRCGQLIMYTILKVLQSFARLLRTLQFSQRSWKLGRTTGKTGGCCWKQSEIFELHCYYLWRA